MLSLLYVIICIYPYKVQLSFENTVQCHILVYLLGVGFTLSLMIIKTKKRAAVKCCFLFIFSFIQNILYNIFSFAKYNL